LQELILEIEDTVNDLENDNNLEVTYKIIKKIRNIKETFKNYENDGINEDNS
jgi:hypothetical protein